MPAPRSARRARLSALVSLVLSFTGFQLFLASEAQASTAPYANLMISEVYGGDGSGSATYHHDFVELFNPTASPISFGTNALFINYISATSASGGAGIAIPAATIPAYTHYLIERTAAGSGVNPVNQDPPHVDAQIALGDIAGAGGRVYLQTTAAAQTTTGDVTGNANIIDAVSGNGSGTLSWEGASVGTVGGGATTSLQRKDDATHGYLDTNTTSTDLKSASPTPKGLLDGPLSVGSQPLALALVADQTGYRNTPIKTIQLAASGGTAPYTYDLTGENGNGLSVDSSGVISGLPNAAGTYHLTAKVTDSASPKASVTRTFTFTVTDGDTANHVVIAQVWGDGGFSGTVYKNDFIELYNPTDNNIDLSGFSIAYVDANNKTNDGAKGTTQQTNLSGNIKAHSYYLVAGVSSGSSGADLPAPDDYSTIDWHYADGTLALVNTQDAFTIPTGDLTGADHVIDAVGYGVASQFTPFGYEGAVTGFITGATVAAQRSPAGTDTNTNNVDFTPIAPIAINSDGDTKPAISLAPVADQTAVTNQQMTPIQLQATGGVGAITYSATGLPAGVSIAPSTGVISGTPTSAGVSTITVKATDTLNAQSTQTFKLTVGSFLVTSPGDQTLAKDSPASIPITASPANTNGYGFAVKSGSTLPVGLSVNPTTGEISGTPTVTQPATPITITVTNNDDASKIDVTFSITVTNSLLSIATIQGTAPRSTYAAPSGSGAGQTVSTQGVVTAVWDKGYSGTGLSATMGTANSGLSGFVIQAPNGNTATDLASDGLFVFYTGTSFTGKDANGAAINVGDSVRVSGTISEFKSASAVSNETATEMTATVANTHKLAGSLGTVTVQATLPATYADREAAEWEAFAPADTVITDTFQYETNGELGVASGNRPLVQPTEICATSQTSCIQTAEEDIVNRGYFLGTGTNVFFTAASTHYNPSKSGNSSIPLPYMDATHPVRVRSHVGAAPGHALILGFWPDLSSTNAARAGKWYLQPDRAVLGTPGTKTTQGTPDLGAGAVSFENTRADNATPSVSNINHDGSSNVRVATFNVENFFTETGQAFAADNPAIGNSADGVTSSTTKGCQYDYDRAGHPTLTFQCVSPFGQATAWDPVSGAPTAYKTAGTNAPRGAGRQVDLDRQTAKIVLAINGLGGIDPNAVNHNDGADIISLEEIMNPNRLRRGITNSPLNPDLSNLKDQGQGTPIANRDEALKYLVDKLNAAAGTKVWGYVKSPEEATDATPMVHMCSIVKGDGVTPIDGNAASRANASCSYASGQDVIRSAFIYKVATVVPVGPSDLDFPNNPLSPDGVGNNAQPTYNNATPFDNAREPLAQFFKRVGDPNSDGFAVIVNHFKSKGGTSTSDDPNISITGDNKSDPLVGAYNQARVKQGQELVRFANEFAKKWNTDKVLILGDFNSYTKEDPVDAILAASQTDPGTGRNPLNFQLIESADQNDITYNFTSNVSLGTAANGTLKVATPNTTAATGTDQVGYGTVGSIDHEFMSVGFMQDFTGADVWEINANETDAYDFGRFNDNATDFYYGTAPGGTVPDNSTYAADLQVATPFRSSDHNPMIIGLDLPPVAAADKVTDVQIVGVNDFHGRLVADASDGGAAALGGAVNELRDQYGADKTIFASGGDNVGASTFESFTAHDKPSLDALSSIGLDVSTVGNHEFDGQASLGSDNVGWKDIVNRLTKKYDATTNPFGPAASAKDPDGLPYLAANVTYSADPDGAGPLQAGDPIAPATKEISVTLDSGQTIKIGFVGTVTPDLNSLESPANLAGIHVDNEAETIAAINSNASQLKADGAKIVVLLTHEGAASTDCSGMLGSGSSFAQELNGLNDNVDAVLSGHTHLEYSCSFPVAGWSGRAITSRPVMQAGSYAVALDQLVYSFDGSGNPVDVTSNLVGVKGPVSTLFSAPQDPDVAAIVADAVSASAAVGATTLGKLGGPFDRARLSDGTENRGGESTLGNQIAEIQRWATSSDDPDGRVSAVNGPAQIAFMNPGGLRADLEGQNADGSGNLTYRSAADVQPFANELTNMTLTGAQIRKVLEEQWSRDNINNANANIPARPFLKLGISKGFSYSYHEVPDPVHSGASLGVVDQMWLNGAQVSLTQTYSVTVNSFLASGGDNFWELANGTLQEDTEQTDLAAQVDYMKQFQVDPLPVDYAQNSARVTFPDGAPSTYSAGDPVSFNLSSLVMTGPHDTQDTTVTVKDGSAVLSAAIPVTVNNTTQPYDNRGNASVSVNLPAGVAGDQVLKVIGNQTGALLATIKLPGVKANATVTAADQAATYGSPGSLTATVSAAASPDGDVTYSEGSTVLGTAPVAPDGTATLSLTAVTLGVGQHTITAAFANSTQLNDASTTFTLTVATATPTITAPDVTVPVGTTGTASVTVTATGVTPTGTVTLKNGATQIGSGTLDNGAVQIDLPVLPDGTVVTVAYSGDANVAAATATFTVHEGAKATPTVTVADATVAYGTAKDVPVTVSATGVTPTGTVTIKDGTNAVATGTLSGGSATLSIPAGSLAVGAHTLSVEYSGDDDVNGASTTFTLTVTKATATVTAPDVTVAVGATGTATVTVTATGVTPTGNVTLRNGATVIETKALTSGQAQFSLPALPDGTVLTVDYAGDANVAARSTTFTVHQGAKATPTVTVANASVVFGQATSIPVTVSATGVAPTGTVTIKEGSTTLGTGTLSGGATTVIIAAGSLVPGAHTLSASYDGDSNVNAATVTFTMTVTKAMPTVTAHNVAVEYGNAATVTVDVAAPSGITPSGTVAVRNGGTVLGTGTVSGGVATVTLPALSLVPGSATLTAEYGGDANLSAGSDPFTVTVSKAASSVRADVDPNHPTRKQKVQLTVKVKGDNGVEATGKVRIKVDGETFTEKLDDGRLKLNLGRFGKGKHKVKMTYLGSTTLEEADDELKFTVS
jgi:2',3'-cyclic-nucleotide 2'-phosphodiesterase (5'-nucleotidase family)/predicted extracellular nuclease